MVRALSNATTSGNEMSYMLMLENADGTIAWECSACKSIVKDKKGFEKITNCPKCGEDITEFHSMYGEYGEYV